MQFTFLDMAGKTLFIRDDAERAQWSVEEKTIDLDFPYIEGKVIGIGQRVFFRDPSTNEAQIFEIKNAKSVMPDGFQQVTAEHICISELTDEHMERKELTDVTCSTALSGVLTGTQWRVGTTSVNPRSSADLDRGSVWQAVLNIESSWNVYIVPRITLASNGTITRYLDIKDSGGEWRGIRLSIDKNFLDPSVTYDDTELVTALYGYGGRINATTTTGEDTECTFADVAWAKTATHPAKPKGQTYLEDPAATKAYGRNGRARFGYYQNMDITDPETLLQKTWEALQNASTPTISVEGSIADLYRLGYADQPIRLHDIALVEVLPAGFKKQIQIIRLTVDLLNPSSTQVSIGDYIPNIIYINRDTNDNITGTRGGGGNKNKTVTERHEFETAIESINAGTGLRFRAFQNDLDDMDNELKLQEGRITVTYNKVEQEVVDRRNADGILSGRITTNADKVALVVEEKSGKNVIKSASIVASINGDSSSIKLNADHIDINGIVTKLETMSIGVGSLYVEGRAEFLRDIYCEDAIVSEEFIISNSGFRVGSLATGQVLNVANAEVSGNTLTITYVDGTTVNFSKATTLTGAWSGGVYTVTASPQGNTKTVGFSQSADSPLSLATNGTPSSVSTNRKLVSAPVRVIETLGTSQRDVYATDLTINASEAWNYGYDTAKDYVGLPGAGTGETFNVLVPNAARTGQDTKTFTIAKGTPASTGGYASVSLSGAVVGRIDISDWWDAGYDAGYEVTSGQISASSFTINYTGSISGRTQLGSFSKANLSGNSYITFQIAVHGTTKRYYITVNN